MSDVIPYTTEVLPDWIDYNGHMQDAYYGLVFSYAVDAFQDAVGFDASYRAATGCTIYLLEDHRRFLREVHQGQTLRVETSLIAMSEKRFLLWAAMFEGGDMVAVTEMAEMHVRQQPKPHGAPIPDEIAARMRALHLTDEEIAALPCRARPLAI